jgi:hypothetical protein
MPDRETWDRHALEYTLDANGNLVRYKSETKANRANEDVDYIQDPETGRFQGSHPHSGGDESSGGETSAGSGNKVSEHFSKANIQVEGDRKAFISEWNKSVRMKPDDFRSAYFGGQKGNLTIRADNRVWELRGYMQTPSTTAQSEVHRTIYWQTKTSSLDYCVIARGDRGKDVGKSVLGQSIALMQKLGMTQDRLHANIDVGGYAWARYGYVPDPDSWAELRHDLQGKLGENLRQDNGVPVESWDMIGESDRNSIENAWQESTRDEFLQSEIENWRESGQALDEAKYQLADNYSNDDWARDAIDEWLDKRDEDEAPVPYTTTQLAEAVSFEYETGYDGARDPEISFDDSKLEKPSNAPPEEQLTLPGVEPVKLSEHLTEEMRDELTKVLTDAFNKKAERDADWMDAPDYLGDNVGEVQSEYWRGMSDNERYDWARAHDLLPSYEEQIDATPDEQSTLSQMLHSSDPKALWAIADSKRGKDMLIWANWHGRLDFKDKAAMDRFHAYVGKIKAKAEMSLAA